MKRHLERTRECPDAYLCTLSKEEIHRKAYNIYYFHNGISLTDLTNRHKIHLVNQYDEEVNVIYDLNEIHKGPPKVDVEVDPEDEPETKPKKTIQDYIVEVDGVKKYQCDRCLSNFTCKRNLLYHFQSLLSCDTQMKTKIIHDALQQIQKASASVPDPVPVPVPLPKLRDFIYDNYDYSHIPKELALGDCSKVFMHHQFLSALLKNDVNKNVYIDGSMEGKYAYFYTNGQIKRAPIEKIAYHLMDKLARTVESYIRTNPLVNADDLAHIIRYYSVEKLKYAMDTPQRDYDMKNQEYIPKSVLYYRTREHYQGILTQSINIPKDTTIQLFKDVMLHMEDHEEENLITEGEIDLPEYYQPTRLRYATPRIKS